MRIPLPLEIYLSGSQPPILAKTINVSAGGLCLALTKKFSKGTIVGVDIYGVKKEPLVCQAKIVWILPRKTNSSDSLFKYDAGLEFQNLKKEDYQAISQMIADCLCDK